MAETGIIAAQEANALAPMNQTAAILDVIARAARDPSVDIDKMERLIAMQERVQAQQAKADFVTAKVAMRPELPEVQARGRIVIKDKNTGEITQETPFAKFEDLQAAVDPILTKNGFDLSYKNGLSPDGKVRVTTILAHIGGHSEETYFDLPHDSSGSKNAVQAVGSSTSYAKRYGLTSILNIRIVGEDDDGMAAYSPSVISEVDAKAIEKDLDDLAADKAAFCQYLGVDSIPQILAKDLAKAKAAVAAKRKQVAKK